MLRLGEHDPVQLVLAGEKVKINKSHGFTTGSNITADHQGVFLFNGKKGQELKSAKDHTAIINADYGFRLSEPHSYRNVQLTVKWCCEIRERRLYFSHRMNHL